MEQQSWLPLFFITCAVRQRNGFWKIPARFETHVQPITIDCQMSNKNLRYRYLIYVRKLSRYTNVYINVLSNTSLVGWHLRCKNKKGVWAGKKSPFCDLG